MALLVKNPRANEGDIIDAGSIPGLERSPGGEYDNPLQYSCLENHHGQRSLAGYSPWGHKESDRAERLGTHINSIFLKKAIINKCCTEHLFILIPVSCKLFCLG